MAEKMDIDALIEREREKLQSRVNRTTAEELARQAGLTARMAGPTAAGAAIGAAMGAPFAGVGAIPGAMIGAGVGSIAYPIADMATTAYNYLTQNSTPLPSQAAERLMTRAGLPEPETATERVVQNAGRGAAGAATGIGAARAIGALLPQGGNGAQIAQTLTQAPGAQMTSGGVGSGVASTATEMGAGPVTSMASGVLASLAPSVRPQHVFPSHASPERLRMNQYLQDQGVPLTPAQQLASPSASVAESVMRYLPTSAARVAGAEDATGRGFTRAVNRQAGLDADNALPETLVQRQREFGQTYDALEQATVLTPDTRFGQDLAQARQTWVRGLDDSQRELFLDTVNQLQGFVNARAQGARMEGASFHMIDGELRTAASSALRSDNPTVQQYGRAMDNLRDSLQGLMERSAQRTQQTTLPTPGGAQTLSGQDLADLWQTTNRQYAIFSRIKDAMGNATGRDKLNTGFVPASALAQEQRSNLGKDRYAMAQDPFTQLVRAGQAVLPDPVPNSGTTQRSFMQNLLTGGQRGAPAAAAGAGANAAGIAAIDPTLALALPYGISRAWYARANPRDVMGLLGVQSLRGASEAER